MGSLYQNGFVPRKLNSPIARRANLNSPKSRRSAIRRLSRDVLATSSPPDKEPAFSCLGSSAKMQDPLTRDLSLSTRMSANARQNQSEVYSLAPLSRSQPGSKTASRPTSALPALTGRAATRPPSPRRLWDAKVTGTPVKAKPTRAEEAPPPLFTSPAPPATNPSKLAPHAPLTPSTLTAPRVRARTAGTDRPSLRKPALAAVGALRLESSLGRLSFVDRGLLLSFSQCLSFFKEHWSTHALPGGAYRSDHASILGAVPCLAALLADVQRKAGATGVPSGVTLVPYASHPPTPSVRLYAGEGLDDALIVHCDGDFARMRWLRAGRAGGATDVSAALIFHFATDTSAKLRPVGREVSDEIRRVIVENETLAHS